MAWLLSMAGLRDLRRDDGLSDVSADVLGDGMSELTLEYQLKQLNERHMEYSAGLQAKIENLERQLDEARKSAMRANAKYVNAVWSESERNKAASDDYMSLVDLYEKEVALADRLQDDLFGIEVYASDTLSGPSEGVPDLNWCLDGIAELHDRAVAGRTAYRKARGL